MIILVCTLFGAVIGEGGWIAWVIYRDTVLHPGRLYVPETTLNVIIYYGSLGIPAALVAAHIGFLFGCILRLCFRLINRA